MRTFYSNRTATTFTHKKYAEYEKNYLFNCILTINKPIDIIIFMFSTFSLTYSCKIIVQGSY